MDELGLIDVLGRPLISQAKEVKINKALVPGGEVEEIIWEATRQVEEELQIEDAGWINFSITSPDVITDAARIANLKLSRLYYTKDPLGKQAIRLWTDYTFGTGMTAHAEDEKTEEARKAFWDAPANQTVLSCRGQRKSSDMLLVDGEVFFALFLGASSEGVKIRRIQPLEITEIITDPDDIEDVRYYRRQWMDVQSKLHDEYYRSVSNVKDVATPDNLGRSVTKTQDALIYHLTYNTIGQRGNPLLLPALDWIKQYRRFLASRVAIMLALARFAWKTKVKGGQPIVDTIKAQTHGKEIAAGSQLLENLGSDTTPIKADSGAKNAHEDARMLKLQVCAAVGIPEQYFGDISTGNLATAKTVELPMVKMFQSYQQVWDDTYQDIDTIVLTHVGRAPDKQYIDRDFPAISPVDYVAMADSIQKIIQVIPELGLSSDVQQQALLSIGVNNPGEVLDALEEAVKKNPTLALTRALKQIREVISNNGNKE